MQMGWGAKIITTITKTPQDVIIVGQWYLHE